MLCILHKKIARYDSLLNAKLPTTDNKHSIWFEKNINNYDLDVPQLCLDGAFPCRTGFSREEAGAFPVSISSGILPSRLKPVLRHQFILWEPGLPAMRGSQISDPSHLAHRGQAQLPQEGMRVTQLRLRR
ncbi:hypothetical protein AUC61_04745 [Pseudomonas sp. S25]|uniref:Uncharacterized protein n=1 Tax=Pseudomonas maioricensis TaxID=1766623 RepID=A0ABS9ZF93_9PSED|nr:hypothetical protein [Pseudomonas sp. S25]